MNIEQSYNQSFAAIRICAFLLIYPIMEWNAIKSGDQMSYYLVQCLLLRNWNYAIGGYSSDC